MLCCHSILFWIRIFSNFLQSRHNVRTLMDFLSWKNHEAAFRQRLGFALTNPRSMVLLCKPKKLCCQPKQKITIKIIIFDSSIAQNLSWCWSKHPSMQEISLKIMIWSDTRSFATLFFFVPLLKISCPPLFSHREMERCQGLPWSIRW
jgi:hypothetical protein